MKTLMLWLVCASVMLAADEKKEAPKMPEVIHLTGGAVLRGVTAERWEKDKVVIRYIGGVAPIPFANIAEPDRTAVLAARGSLDIKTDAPVVKTRTVTGQVFVPTAGAGSYKFGAVLVAAYSQEIWDSVSASWQTNLPIGHRLSGAYSRQWEAGAAWEKALKGSPVLGWATTDADGNFTITLPENAQVFLYCRAERLAGSHPELDLWVVKVNDESRVDLTTLNLFIEQ